jgi:hypothetical protein
MGVNGDKLNLIVAKKQSNVPAWRRQDQTSNNAESPATSLNKME